MNYYSEITNKLSVIYIILYDKKRLYECDLAVVTITQNVSYYIIHY